MHNGDEGTTRLLYEVLIQPNGPVPVLPLEWRIREDVPTNLKSVKLATMKMAQRKERTTADSSAMLLPGAATSRDERRSDPSAACTPSRARTRHSRARTHTHTHPHALSHNCAHATFPANRVLDARAAAGSPAPP